MNEKLSWKTYKDKVTQNTILEVTDGHNSLVTIIRPRLASSMTEKDFNRTIKALKDAMVKIYGSKA